MESDLTMEALGPRADMDMGLDPLVPLTDSSSWWDFNWWDFSSYLGISLLGIIAGELINRIILLLEELSLLMDRYGGRPLKLLQAVFSNCHYQVVTMPALIVVGLCLVLLQPSAPLFSAMVAETMTVALVYATLRTCGALDNSLEDIQVLEENNALLGPGLAANYWFSFLKWIITGEVGDVKGTNIGYFKDAMENTESQANFVKDREIEKDGQMMAKLSEVGGPNSRVFCKMIILLPSVCHLEPRNPAMWKEEKVFVMCHQKVPADTPLCQCKEICPESCPHRLCTHFYNFKVESVQRRPPIKHTVYWIYEREEDERWMNPKGAKIFVMFDFPMLLQSSMGPDRGWEESDRPGARARNIETFRETLVSFLGSNDYNRYQDLVTFHPFAVSQEEEPKKLLSAQIRDRVLRDEAAC